MRELDNGWSTPTVCSKSPSLAQTKPPFSSSSSQSTQTRADQHLRNSDREPQDPAHAGGLPSEATPPSEDDNRKDDSLQTDDSPQAQWGERRIYLVGDEGPDVRELQRRLRNFGFAPPRLTSASDAFITGVFDEATRAALIKFQAKFGIFVDGVMGDNSVMVLDYLERLGVSPDTPPLSDEELRLIRWAAGKDQRGMVLLGVADSLPENRQHETGTLFKIVNVIRHRLDSRRIYQTALLPKNRAPEEYPRISDQINAEFLLLLCTADDSAENASFTTRFYGSKEFESFIGAPLARTIHAEIGSSTNWQDRGCLADDADLLKRAHAATVTLTLGHVAEGEISPVADAVVAAIEKLYDLNVGIQTPNLH